MMGSFAKFLLHDNYLWRNWSGAVAVLVYATALWYLFERVGYNFLSFVTKVFANKLWCLLWTLGSRRSWSKISWSFLFCPMYFRHVSLYFIRSYFFPLHFSLCTSLFLFSQKRVIGVRGFTSLNSFWLILLLLLLLFVYDVLFCGFDRCLWLCLFNKIYSIHQ